MIAAALVVAWAALADEFSGPGIVIDGDSIRVAGREVRLSGIDAPEWNQPCRRAGRTWYAGRESSKRLRARLKGKTVTCAGEGTDRYGRTLATCAIDGAEINAAMVADGWAFAYRGDARHIGAETAARDARLGLWQGSCAAPWDWRHADAAPRL